jgi:predicted DNA repair protein MutK
LSTVLDKSFWTQIFVVSVVALLATFFVYWIVAFIVRLDDMWFFLQKKCKKSFWKKIWEILVLSLPIIIKILSVVWTWAMLLVGWGLFRHYIPYIHHFYEKVSYIPWFIFDTILAFIVWYILVWLFFLYRKIKTK